MSIVKQKRIIIDDNRPIYPKGGIYGPVLTPYKETVEVIATLVTQGYNVYEVLEDGTRVKLDLRNLNKNNNKPVSKPEVKYENKKQNNQQNVNKSKNKNVDTGSSNDKVEDTVVDK